MTDEEILKIYGKAKRDFCYDGPIDDWPRHAERAATMAGLRALIEHVRPAPVAAIQRPWNQEGWLDELSMGWMFHPQTGCTPIWELVHVSAMIERRNAEILWKTEFSPIKTVRMWTMCLPHWAIPLPLACPEDHFPGFTKMPAEDQP
jgi:hypothetical protein